MNKRIQTNRFLVLVSCLAIFAGCGGGSDTSTPSNSSKLSNIDISGASSLFIADSTNSSASMSAAATSTTQKRIFKITPDGYIMEVTFKDITGQTFTYQYEPAALHDVNSQWIIITFGDVGYPSSGFLVRKTDGAVYELKNPPGVNGYTFNNAKNVQLDATGNIYYVNNGDNQTGAVYKLDVSDQNNITETRVTPDTDHPLAYFVNPKGHIYYYFSNENRIRMTNGGLVNLPTGQSLSAWIDLDGNITYLSGGYFDVVIDDNFNVSTIQNPNPLLVEFYSNDVSSYLVKFVDRTIIVSYFGNIGLSILEVENPSNTPRKINLTEISQFDNVIYSNNYYYISGIDSNNNPILLKVDPIDDSTNILLPTSGNYYDIQNMKVSSDGTIIFNALRMSDGTKVIGKIDASEQMSILNETSSYSVTQLEIIDHFQ